jgi:hypothetical protein
MARRLIGTFIGVVTALSVLSSARPALAGYATRLMYPFDIGDARSLPWGSDWSRGRADYNLANLISDTEALLTPSTPIIVRLETLRRAVIYASADRRVAERLLLRFSERAHAAEQSGKPDALAFLDAAFVTDTLWQIGPHYNPPFTEPSRQVQGLVGSADGYDLVRKGLALRPNDPAYEFGAALIAGVTHLGGAAFVEHARNALAGAARDALLARNLDRIYADRAAWVSRLKVEAIDGRRDR